MKGLIDLFTERNADGGFGTDDRVDLAETVIEMKQSFTDLCADLKV
jgi:hypothetical protein